MKFTIHISGPPFAAHVVQSNHRGADLLKGKRCLSVEAAQDECRRVIAKRFAGIECEFVWVLEAQGNQ